MKAYCVTAKDYRPRFGIFDFLPGQWFWVANPQDVGDLISPMRRTVTSPVSSCLASCRLSKELTRRRKIQPSDHSVNSVYHTEICVSAMNLKPMARSSHGHVLEGNEEARSSIRRRLIHRGRASAISSSQEPGWQTSWGGLT